MLKKFIALATRHNRIRAKVSGTASRPRLSVYRSNANIYAQVIDDVAQKTICAASDIKITKWTKIERASLVGQEIAKKAMDLGIKEVVFDRGGFIYMGRVKTLADAAREKWLKF